jgi:hypothetical protein
VLVRERGRVLQKTAQVLLPKKLRNKLHRSCKQRASAAETAQVLLQKEP